MKSIKTRIETCNRITYDGETVIQVGG